MRIKKNFWLGTWDEGLQRFDRESGAFVRFDLSKDYQTGEEAFRVNSVIKLVEDLQNPKLLWLGSSMIKMMKPLQ